MNQKNKIIALIVLVFIIVIGGIVGWYTINNRKEMTINSYDECAAAGYPILESYPEQCTAPNGKTYTRIPSQEKAVSLKGEIVCLSHKDMDGPHTLECAMGIKTDEGKYYGITSEPYDMALSETGRKVQINGSLKLNSSTKYQSEGTVVVTSYTFID
jgi:hypothetical protein